MDKTINLSTLNLVDRSKPENKEAPADATLFTNYVGYVVNKAFEGGMNGDKRRLYNRLLEKFDKAIDEKSETVVVNNYEYLFLKDAFEKAVVEPANTMMVTKVENGILNAV